MFPLILHDFRKFYSAEIKDEDSSNVLVAHHLYKHYLAKSKTMLLCQHQSFSCSWKWAVLCKPCLQCITGSLGDSSLLTNTRRTNAKGRCKSRKRMKQLWCNHLSTLLLVAWEQASLVALPRGGLIYITLLAEPGFSETSSTKDSGRNTKDKTQTKHKGQKLEKPLLAG